MPRKCTVCDHDQRHDVDIALVRRKPYRHIAARFDVTTQALQRHSHDHLPELLVKAKEDGERGNAKELAAELSRVKEDVRRLKGKAEEEGDIRTALLGCDKALKALELQAKVEQIIASQPTVNITVSPEWLEVKAVILQAIDRHPEILGEIEEAFERAEALNA
jgi:hypothetical protein